MMIDLREELETALTRIAELEGYLDQRNREYEQYVDVSNKRIAELERRLKVIGEWMVVTQDLPRFSTVWESFAQEHMLECPLDWFDEETGEVR